MGMRLEKAQDSGFEENDTVFVKLTQIREDGKISLSMKDIDQNSGKDWNMASAPKN
jgi:predicted RNA-binding protein with RPS1 domain